MFLTEKRSCNTFDLILTLYKQLLNTRIEKIGIILKEAFQIDTNVSNIYNITKIAY
ncbi:hypothetical protein FPFC_020530 [Fructobacillus pseudoficulneus]|uniref:Uncharacterized protein n=1 Tax=Fructobacillus pseudoficulneus TaxID=220714 RepID=A0A3F3GSS5_9LACO|nr:hypothetical protein FPFC_020530 [Fructobacillus pseudoficulneus]